MRYVTWALRVLPGMCPNDENPRGGTLEGFRSSDHKPFDLEFDSVDLAGKFLVLVRRNARSDDGPCNTAGTAQCSFGLDEDVRHILSQDKISEWALINVSSRMGSPSPHKAEGGEEEFPAVRYPQ